METETQQSVKTIYGDDLYEHVPAWRNALGILRAAGRGITAAYVHPIWYKDWYTGNPKSGRYYVHVYFLGADGREVAYFTPCVQYLTVFATPRTVSPEWLANAEHPDGGPIMALNAEART